MRENRPKWSEFTDIQKRKSIARSYANTYLKRGIIEKEPCSKCGFEKSQMHHENYDKPIEIIWLCRKCHLKIHNAERETIQKCYVSNSQLCDGSETNDKLVELLEESLIMTK